MRILIISDSHRRGDIVEDIIRRQPEARHVFFLGDLTADIEDMQYVFSDRIFHIVSGNCDYFSLYKSVDTAVADGKKILFTHGHTFGVKHSPDAIITAAREKSCQIALYGHTHTPDILYEKGVCAVNPGSCSEPRNGSRTYAFIDIEPSGIMPVIVEL